MTAAALGTMTGPVLLFGGAYGNLEATEALLGEADRLGIPPERVICTGDVVAYCADPVATIDLLRGSGMSIVMGNCEESLALGQDGCGCGFGEGSACDLLSQQWFAYCDARVDAERRQWMGALPRRLSFSMGERRFAVIHGGVGEIARFLFASSPPAELAEEFSLAGTDAVIGGHCGLPFSRLVDDRLWHNAGVIGMPANDGTPRVWYSLLRQEGNGLCVERRALTYDHQTAAAKMRARDLPEGYAAALSSGLWPNCDILPPAERAARGRPLAEGTTIWSAGPK